MLRERSAGDVVAEIVPQAERDGRQHEAAPARAAVEHFFVAGRQQESSSFVSPDGARCCAGGAASRRPGARGRAASVDQPFSAGTQSPCASSRSSTRSEISAERQLGRRMRVEHRRVLGVVLAAGDDRLDRQLLHVDVGLHQRRELRRQAADADRLDAVVVDRGTAPRRRCRRAGCRCGRGSRRCR